MKTIDISQVKLTAQEVAEQVQEEMITLCKGETALAVVMSMVEYKEAEKLWDELAKSKSENRRESQ